MAIGFPRTSGGSDNAPTHPKIRRRPLVAVHGRYPETQFELAAINQRKYPGTFRVSHNDIGRVARAEELVATVKKPQVKIAGKQV